MAGIKHSRASGFAAILSFVLMIFAGSAFGVTYRITFNANGGTFGGDQGSTTYKDITGTDAEHVTLGTLPSNPTRDYYTFVGWFMVPDATDGAKVTSSTTFNRTTTVFAGWELSSPVTITFNPTGGTVSPTSAKTGEGGKLASLPTPAKDGAIFSHWSLVYDDASTEKEVTTDMPFSVNTEIYAQWAPAVKLDANGGTIAGMPDAIAIGEGGKIKTSSLPKVGKKDYYNDSLVGWYTAETGGVKVTASTVFSENTTIYARWKPVDFTIDYNLDGGTDPTPPNPATYTIETATFTLKPPTKAGNEFDGWTGSNGTAKQLSVTIEKGNKENKNYKANWKAVQYTITFDPKGGTISETAKTAKTASGTGKLTSSLPLSTLTDYYLEGWFTAAGEKVETNKTVFSGDATVSAKWTRTYTVTFNANGGSVSPASSKTGSGGKLASLPTPTRSNALFDGWYTAEKGGIKVTKDDVYAKDAILYAHWTTSYTVVFLEPNNGMLTAKVNSVPINSGDTVSFGRSVAFTAIPNEGYKVSGWTSGGSSVSGNTSTNYTLTGVTVSAVAVTVAFAKIVAVAEHERVIPNAVFNDDVAVIAPITERSRSALNDEIIVGPNPVSRSSEKLNIFRNGGRILSAKLGVYDASGNFVNTVTVLRENVGAEDFQPLQATVGSWDLRDKNGRLVPEGTYLIKGTIKTQNGKSEKVALVVGVR